MILISDIYKSLASRIGNALIAADVYAPIIASDLKEPITRPSIKIMIDDDATFRHSTHVDARSFVARIYYFPPDAHSWRGNHFMMQDILRECLYDSLFVGNYELDSEDGIQFVQTDGVLLGSIAYQWYECRPVRESGERMEELNINLK